MRTVWLATTCLAVLGALAVAKALTTPVAPIVERQMDETTVATGLAQDTLTKADRLEITYVRQEIPAQPKLHPTEPFIPPFPTIVPPVREEDHQPTLARSKRYNLIGHKIQTTQENGGYQQSQSGRGPFQAR